MCGELPLPCTQPSVTLPHAQSVTPALCTAKCHHPHAVSYLCLTLRQVSPPSLMHSQLPLPCAQPSVTTLPHAQSVTTALCTAPPSCLRTAMCHSFSCTGTYTVYILHSYLCIQSSAPLTYIQWSVPLPYIQSSVPPALHTVEFNA